MGCPCYKSDILCPVFPQPAIAIELQIRQIGLCLSLLALENTHITPLTFKSLHLGYNKEGKKRESLLIQDGVTKVMRPKGKFLIPGTFKASSAFKVVAKISIQQALTTFFGRDRKSNPTHLSFPSWFPIAACPWMDHGRQQPPQSFPAHSPHDFPTE